MATGTNIFISYASDTKPLAEELTRALESQGIEPWVDFKDLQPGQRWREELERAIDAALRTCNALPGLRGYIGVDLVLTESDAVVIEVNPRLTTSYLGLRSALRGDGGNVAAMALAACAGELATPPPMQQRVRFTAAGRVVLLR